MDTAACACACANKLSLFVDMDVTWVESLKDMPLRSDDIWVVCYPKSGTQWTSQIVRLILNKGQDDGGTLSDAVPWVEAFTEEYRVNINEKPSPRAFRSHFIYEQMPCGPPDSTPCKYIYVARNPKDVLVSAFFYRKGFKSTEKLTWEEHFEDFIAGTIGHNFGDYFQNVLSWWRQRHHDNILFLKFEDMKRDLSGTVAIIAKFIGQDIGQGLIDDIAEKSTFDNMKADNTVRLGYPHELRSSEATCFFRKGAVGDWKTYLTDEQSARIDKDCEEKLKPAGLIFDFES